MQPLDSAEKDIVRLRCKQNWRRTHKRKHIHKEKTLRNDRQPVHSLMECRQFRQEV